MKPPYPEKQSHRKEWIRWTGTAISAGLFIWLLARQDWQELARNLSRIPLWTFPVALGLYMVRMVINALRWHILLQAPKIRIPIKETIKIVYAGAFASNFLPSTIGGDAYRLVSILQYTPNRIASLTSLILDRLVNLSAFTTVLPFTILTFGSPIRLLKELLANLAAAPVLAASIQNRIGKKYIKRVRLWLKKGRKSFQTWLTQPAILGKAFMVSWLSIFFSFLAIWVLAIGLGIPVALYQVMGVTAITYLVTLLPISVNGYGLREILIVGLYTQLGGTIEQATALAVITRFMSLSATLPGALWVAQTIHPDRDKHQQGKQA